VLRERVLLCMFLLFQARLKRCLRMFEPHFIKKLRNNVKYVKAFLSL
jgi:hypothetical protein